MSNLDQQLVLAQFAAKWWADCLRNKQEPQSKNAQIDGDAGMMLDLLTAMREPELYGKVDKFEKLLTDKIMAKFADMWGNRLDMYCDYDPPALVDGAADECGIIAFGSFPFKSGIVIDVDKMTITEKRGYGGDYVEVFKINE